jgi:hypothetical protein
VECKKGSLESSIWIALFNYQKIQRNLYILFQKKYLSHPSPDLDVLKMLAVPTVDSALIQCLYFMEIHVYYKGGLTTDKLKALRLPILVCRPILGAPIANFP